MMTYLHRASNLKSTVIFLASVHGGSQFLATAKNRRFLRLNFSSHSTTKTNDKKHIAQEEWL